MIDLTRLNYRIRNCVLSQHGTDHLADCNQCGMKPKRMWSHSGAVIGCECSVLTNANGAGWGTLEHSWQILQGACTEADELRTNLAKAHEDHNLYRAEMRANLEDLIRLYKGYAENTLIWRLRKMLKTTRKQD